MLQGERKKTDTLGDYLVLNIQDVACCACSDGIKGIKGEDSI
jgi:hypothetical protein